MHIFKSIALITSIILISLVLLLAAVNTVFHIIYRDFYKRAEPSFTIPGLGDGFVPQGVTEVGESILVSGYMTKDRPSRIYAVKNGKSSYAEILNADGTPYKGHGGGIDTYGDRAFLAGDGALEILSLSDVLDGDGKATVKGSFDPGLDPAWCTVSGECIFMGSFAYNKVDNYKPEEKETFTTPTGEKNVSLIKCFALDSTAPNGINPTPMYAISAGEKVQGLAFADENTLILSTSYGLTSSLLIFHSTDKMKDNAGEYITDDGKIIPLYYLDSHSKTREVKAPPMSEELLVKDGYVYIMNESASDKYIFGKLLGQSKAYRYKI